MAKEKRSFFERFTGARKIGDDDVSPENENTTTMEVFGDDQEMRMNMRRDDSLTQPSFSDNNTPSASQNDAEGQLTIDVYQTDHDIVIKSTIAGVKPEDLDVAINNDMVTIKGERVNEETVEEEGYYYQECYWGSFSRSVVLPVDVLAEKADATLKNGILTIRLPKADTTKTKKIQVRGF